MKVKKYYFLFCFLLLPLLIQGQEDLRESQEYIEEGISQYKEWLEDSNFSQVFYLKDYTINSDFLEVKLKGQYENRDSLAQAYFDLDSILVKESSIKREEGETLPILLLERISFDADVPLDSVKLIIEGDNPYFFEVKASFQEDKGFVVYQEIDVLRGEDDPIKINISDLRSGVKSQIVKGKSLDIKAATTLLYEKMLKYYKSLGTSLYGKGTAEVACKKRGNYFILKTTYISNEIINTNYEYIWLRVEVGEQSGELIIEHNIRGKYGDGFIYAPRSVSDYEDIEKDYPAEMEEYREEIGNKLYDILSN